MATPARTNPSSADPFRGDLPRAPLRDGAHFCPTVDILEGFKVKSRIDSEKVRLAATRRDDSFRKSQIQRVLPGTYRRSVPSLKGLFTVLQQVATIGKRISRTRSDFSPASQFIVASSSSVMATPARILRLRPSESRPASRRAGRKSRDHHAEECGSGDSEKRSLDGEFLESFGRQARTREEGYSQSLHRVGCA
jgi:hypothetical protein